MKRQITTLELTPHARESLDRISDLTGMRKKDALERIVTWFAEQDDVVRSCVLGLWPKSVAPDIARMLLERLAAEAKRQAPSGRANAEAHKPTGRRVRIGKDSRES